MPIVATINLLLKNISENKHNEFLIVITPTSKKLSFVNSVDPGYMTSMENKQRPTSIFELQKYFSKQEN